ncbi:hypothetical protein BZA05DRAFT_165566 [Tricharina praecox]|uniref:uncharacterized protein n=1 Tax=Tricharina praecox TaxID=43433 RepID=UPI00222060F3|nr:uncharacterized protein BZA05DRAFT_165566 [Tricharina praecox]KAI5857076.1 hypothetical protein BZA05DRAFT_165566 [Tricharina praecox]
MASKHRRRRRRRHEGDLIIIIIIVGNQPQHHHIMVIITSSSPSLPFTSKAQARATLPPVPTLPTLLAAHPLINYPTSDLESGFRPCFFPPCGSGQVPWFWRTGGSFGGCGEPGVPGEDFGEDKAGGVFGVWGGYLGIWVLGLGYLDLGNRVHAGELGVLGAHAEDLGVLGELGLECLEWGRVWSLVVGSVDGAWMVWLVAWKLGDKESVCLRLVSTVHRFLSSAVSIGWHKDE